MHLETILWATRRRRPTGDSWDGESWAVEGDVIFESGSMSLKLFMFINGLLATWAIGTRSQPVSNKIDSAATHNRS